MHEIDQMQLFENEIFSITLPICICVAQLKRMFPGRFTSTRTRHLLLFVGSNEYLIARLRADGRTRPTNQSDDDLSVRGGQSSE